MLERRRYYRLKNGVTLKYKPAGHPVGSFGSDAQDVGGGGVRILVDRRLTPGDALEVSLRFPEDKEPLSALARVAWQIPQSRKDAAGKSVYETGVEFLKMNLKDRLQIIHYVYSKIKQKTIKP
jgi:c-di-GMP-binding flagellar brake protein YcgR